MRKKTTFVLKFSKKVIQIHDKSFELFIAQDEIKSEINSLGKILNTDYAGKEVIFIAILNGAFMFASDLMKVVTLPCEVSFVKVSSYQGMNSTGRVDELIGLTSNLKGKHVVLVEDIVDTGITMDKLFTLLQAEHPESIEIVTLLYKPEAHKGKHVPKYVGFSIPNSFVVGFGLDYNEHGRNLPEIYQLKAE